MGRRLNHRHRLDNGYRCRRRHGYRCPFGNDRCGLRIRDRQFGNRRRFSDTSVDDRLCDCHRCYDSSRHSYVCRCRRKRTGLNLRQRVCAVITQITAFASDQILITALRPITTTPTPPTPATTTIAVATIAFTAGISGRWRISSGSRRW